MTTPKTEAGRQFIDNRLVEFYEDNHAEYSQEQYDAMRDGYRFYLEGAFERVEQEAGRLAVAEVLSVERIAENLTSLFQQAFPTTDRDETAYLIDSWIWAEGAAALYAALTEKPQETPE